MPENSRTTLITGATGDIGTALTGMLADAGASFRVLCRRPEQMADFTARGIDVVQGDLADPGSMRAALSGCQQLFLLPPASPDLEHLARTAVDAARDTDVEHIVKISAADADPASPVPWAAAHARADTYLRDSGVPWTSMRAAAFMENLAETAPPVRRGLLPGTSRGGATAWVSTTDVAAASTRVLLDPGTQGGSGSDGRMWRLSGNPPLSYPQVADILTAELGRRVRYLHLPGPLMYLALRAGGQSDWMARGLVHQFADVVRHGRDGVLVHSPDLEDLLGRPPIDMAAYVRAHLDTFS